MCDHVRNLGTALLSDTECSGTGAGMPRALLEFGEAFWGHLLTSNNILHTAVVKVRTPGQGRIKHSVENLSNLIPFRLAVDSWCHACCVLTGSATNPEAPLGLGYLSAWVRVAVRGFCNQRK